MKQIRSLGQRVARDTNGFKLKALNALYTEWQTTAEILSTKIWHCFLQNNQMPEGLKASGDVNNPNYIFPTTLLGASQKDCMLVNALGTLKSWLSNLDNRFNATFNKINRNNPDYAQLAHELCWINSNHLWRMNNMEQNTTLRQKYAQKILRTAAEYNKKIKEATTPGKAVSEYSPPYQLPENILKLLFQGKISSIVVTHEDRLMRFGFALIECVCQYLNVKIIIIQNNQTEPDFTTQLTLGLVEIITVFSAKLYGQRSAQAGVV